MEPTQLTRGNAAPTVLPPLQRVVAAADEQDAMREQLEYVFENIHDGVCRCPECEKYKALRLLLLDPFKVTVRTAKQNG
jgi:hypothetical protein